MKSNQKSRISCSGLLLCRLVFLGHGGLSLLLRAEIFWQVRASSKLPICFIHGLINYKDAKTKCRYLKKLTCKGTSRQVFMRVYRLEIQSVMLVFQPSLNYCPSNLLSGSPPPFPCAKVQYTYTVSV